MITKTLTREEIIKDLKPKIAEYLTAKLGAFVEHGHNEGNFIAFKNINGRTNETLAEFWCDLCSDEFFDKNPDVEDVLMLDHVEHAPVNDIKFKIWLASR